MLPSKLAFVDFETTGTSSARDRIIEVGIVLVDDNKITDTYSTLLNPQTYIPSFISDMTGINANELENAPTFSEVHEKITELLSDRIFVAHNVRFDYGFLKHEYKRIHKSYASKHFCTVRLSRVLFPELGRHNLDTIINHFNIEVKNRHRALDDAVATFSFYQKAQEKISPDAFESAITTILKKPYLPSRLTGKLIDDLPESPGVYIFYGEEDAPLYIGKSINIKERVLSHFSDDIHSPLEMKISQQIERIETLKTAGELGALFLESHLIKTRLPLYNRMLRHTQALVLVKRVMDKKGYYHTTIEKLDQELLSDVENIIGVFRSQKQAKEYLAELSLKHKLCEKLLGIEKTSAACFGYRLERCKGACVEKEVNIAYNMRFIEAFSSDKFKPWPFNGPIIITESDIFEKTNDYFLVDNWCLLGKIKTDEYDSFVEENYEYNFDLDTYKILARYLLHGKNRGNIRQIKPDQIENYTTSA